MIFFWIFPEKYPNRNIGIFDDTCSPNRFLLMNGRFLPPDEFNNPTVRFIAPQNVLLKYDCLPNNTLVPLINERLKNILEDMAPNDVQFIPTNGVCPDGLLKDYYFLNFTNTIVGIDHEKSVYTKMLYGDHISGFSRAVYKPNCMGEHLLARDSEYHSHILVAKKLKDIFDKEKIKGVRLALPDEYYCDGF